MYRHFLPRINVALGRGTCAAVRRKASLICGVPCLRFPVVHLAEACEGGFFVSRASLVHLRHDDRVVLVIVISPGCLLLPADAADKSLRSAPKVTSMFWWKGTCIVGHLGGAFVSLQVSCGLVNVGGRRRAVDSRNATVSMAYRSGLGVSKASVSSFLVSTSVHMVATSVGIFRFGFQSSHCHRDEIGQEVIGNFDCARVQKRNINVLHDGCSISYIDYV